MADELAGHDQVDAHGVKRQTRSARHTPIIWCCDLAAVAFCRTRGVRMRPVRQDGTVLLDDASGRASKALSDYYAGQLTQVEDEAQELTDAYLGLFGTPEDDKLAEFVPQATGM